jgi:hypothetical protein
MGAFHIAITSLVLGAPILAESVFRANRMLKKTPGLSFRGVTQSREDESLS